MTLTPERLHVIRCYDRLPPMPGGMERHIAELTAAQRAMGVRVTELYNSGMPAGEAIQLWRGLRTDRIQPNLLRWGLFYAAAAMRRIDFSDGRVRILHIHGDWHAFLLGRYFARRLRVAGQAASMHGALAASDARYGRLLVDFSPIFTTGLANSERLSRAVGRRVIHLPSAPNDLFFARPATTRGTCDVVAVGNLFRVKNYQLLLHCAAKRPDLQFKIVGEGPDRHALEKLAADLALTNVEFCGAMQLADVHSTLGAAKLFINTSHSEGSPTAALEAMACGLPVVLTPSNDYSSLVRHGINGIVTTSWDLHEVLRAIDHFLGNPERLPRAAATARETAQQHRWNVKAQLVTDAMIAAVQDRTEIGE